jgi:hypothetical protein
LTRQIINAAGELNWTRASRRRSAIAAVPALYAGHVADANLPDTSELDAVLRAAAPYYGPARSVPPKLPASDWWWWAPDEPPERGG